MNCPVKIVQIVPQLPPMFDGLGDHGLNLAQQLRSRYGVETHFVVGDPNWSDGTESGAGESDSGGNGSVEGFAATAVSRHDRFALRDLFNRFQPDAVLLHYVSYGYAKRGCPFWLIDAIAVTPLVTGGRFGAAIAVAVVYFGMHGGLDAALDVAAPPPLGLAAGLAAWTVLCFAGLFAVQTWLASSRAHDGAAARLHGWLFGGLYLDAWFTRLTLRVWPNRRPPDVRDVSILDTDSRIGALR